jgi:hypothetical protein
VYERRTRDGTPSQPWYRTPEFLGAVVVLVFIILNGVFF